MREDERYSPPSSCKPGSANSRLEQEMRRRNTSVGQRLSVDLQRKKGRGFPPLLPRSRSASETPHGEGGHSLLNRLRGIVLAPHYSTLSVRTYDWVREIRDGHTAHEWRTQVFLFLNDPAGTVPAYFYMMLMNVLSLIAVMVFVMQESHIHNQRTGEAQDTLNVLFWDINLVNFCIFGIELPARMLVHPSWERMLLRDYWIYIDVLVMIPLAIRVFLGPSPESVRDSGGDVTEEYWFRTLEALTSLRLLRLARYFHGGMLLGQALARSASALLVPFYMLGVITMFFGGLLYACEGATSDMLGGPNATGPEAGVQVLSLPDSIWLMFVTMTTVGYGDCARWPPPRPLLLLPSLHAARPSPALTRARPRSPSLALATNIYPRARSLPTIGYGPRRGRVCDARGAGDDCTAAGDRWRQLHRAVEVPALRVCSRAHPRRASRACRPRLPDIL